MSEPIALWNLAIIALTVYCSYKGFSKPAFLESYLFIPEHILRDKQYYRLISSGFLHANWVHLIFNMYSLYCFGSTIERRFGFVTFLIIYFASILGGGLLSLYLHRNHDYRALGASGGVCGIIFACIFLLPGTSIRIFLVPIAIPAYIYAVVFVIGSYFGIRHKIGNIGHDAHLGGAIIGLMTTTALHPSIVSQNPVLYTIVMSISLGFFVYLYKHSLHPQIKVAFSLGRFRDKISESQIQNEQISRSRDEATINRLLEKISESGIHSLTRRERKKLQEISKRRNTQHS